MTVECIVLLVVERPCADDTTERVARLQDLGPLPRRLHTLPWLDGRHQNDHPVRRQSGVEAHRLERRSAACWPGAQNCRSGRRVKGMPRHLRVVLVCLSCGDTTDVVVASLSELPALPRPCPRCRGAQLATETRLLFVPDGVPPPSKRRHA
jgi:hypothetical protein